MQNGAKARVQDRIRELVEAMLAENAVAATVFPDASLADLGLTSMDMVNLMLGVEAEFDLMIPQDEITPENFRSVRSIEQVILKVWQHETLPRGASMPVAGMTDSAA